MKTNKILANMNGSGKLTGDKMQFRCPLLIKGILKITDIKNKIYKDRRTYWIWITFDYGIKIRLGNFSVERQDDEGEKLPSNIIYHQLHQGEQEPIFQLVSKTLDTMTYMQGKTLKKNEQIAVVYTEIKNSQADHKERTRELIVEIKKRLDRYEVLALQEHFHEKIDSAMLQMRLEQINKVQNELDKLIEASGELYKKSKGQDVYMLIET